MYFFLLPFFYLFCLEGALSASVCGSISVSLMTPTPTVRVYASALPSLGLGMGGVVFGRESVGWLVLVVRVCLERDVGIFEFGFGGSRREVKVDGG